MTVYLNQLIEDSDMTDDIQLFEKVIHIFVCY